MREQADRTGERLRAAKATTNEEKEAVSKLRYRVYVDEMSKRPADADHAKKMIADDLDEVATIFYLADGNDVIATVRSISAAHAAHSKYARFYQLDKMSEVAGKDITFTSHLIIAPEWRGTRALGRLLDSVYEHGRGNGAWLDFIHCAPSLVALYEVVGYRRFMPSVMETEVGLRVPLALVADDVAYLTKTRSPFARLAPKFPNDPEHGRWFATRFAEYAEPSCARVMGNDDFWSYVTGRIHVEDHPLLQGLSEDEIKRILSAGTIIRVPKGEAAVRTGDVGSDMFMVLSGAAEVRAGSSNGPAHVLETLGKGQIFGEMSFLSNRPRTADVVAISDVELLSLNREFLERLTRSVPAAASRMLLNLSAYLVDRLQNTTQSLVDLKGRGDEGSRPALH